MPGRICPNLLKERKLLRISADYGRKRDGFRTCAVNKIDSPLR